MELKENLGDTEPVINTLLRASEVEYTYKDIVENYKLGKDKVFELEKQVSTLKSKLILTPKTTAKKIKKSGSIPEGRVVEKTLSDIFPDIQGFSSSAMKIPTFEWDGEHPDVPEEDLDYVMREELIFPFLYAMVFNQRAWLQGHTGSGKTTFVEQMAARLKWPFAVINFDSEILRSDLIGQVELVADGKGGTETRWVDGVLPKVMSQPYICCLDELDFIRPDVAYVMQRALEGNALRILEDSGREVVPHEMFRFVATGNTVGQGDNLGIYAGARPQSAAFLNRFTTWMKVDYLTEEQVVSLLEKNNPGLDKKELKFIGELNTKMVSAFKEGQITQAFSPRTFNSLAEKIQFFKPLSESNYMKLAIDTTLVSAARPEDARVISEVVKRLL